jgi:iron complex outermembrane recepter protein
MNGYLLIALAIVCAAPAFAPRTALSAAERASSTTETSISGRVKNAATGQYLNKARVTVKGTDLVAYTDDFGEYRLVGIPAGPVVLDVFYTDLDPLLVPLSIPAGQSVEQNIELTSKSRYGTDGQVVKLDPYLVGSNKETDAQAIATNEQRFAPNVINVLATDAMGDLVGNDPGEFLKFLPGLAAEFQEGDVGGISVRGIGADLTTISIDGAPVVTGSNSGPTRTVDMRAQSINNISRIEVTKVPTPSSPADSLAGSVNMVSKSAFERSKPEFRVGLYLVGNGGEPTLKKTPHPYGDKDTLKTQESWDFEYALPASKNFGIVVTGMQSHKYTPQNRITTMWTSAATGSTASVSDPYFQQLAPRVAPRSKSLTAFSFKADWRVTPHSVLSMGNRWSKTIAARTGSLSVTANAGTNGTPSVVGGVPLSFGPDFTIGATGRGGITLASAQQYSIFENMSHYLKYRFDDGKWRLETNVAFSSSDTDLNPNSQKAGGFFPTVNVTLVTPNRVTFRGVGADGPQVIEAFDNNNRPIDIYDIRNYRINTASEDVRHLDNDLKQASVDLRRRLALFSFPSALQVGGLYRIHTMDRNNPAAGAMTASAAATDAAPYAYRVYVNKEHYARWNFPNVYPARVHEAFTNTPSLFTRTPAQVVNAEISRLNTSQFAEQAVGAGYVQGEARLLSNRLNVLTGVRFERTEVGGEGVLIDPGAAFVRNTDGTFARNAQGQRIRRPEAGAANSIQEVAVTRTERGYKAEQSYDGFYPSVHLTYNIRENFQARLAYAKTYGRPDFPDVIPSATIQEADLGERELADPNAVKGNITVTNTALKPWTAHNYDLSLEYYTPQGGVFSAGAFLKEISNFFGTETKIATAADLEELSLEPEYVGWFLQTKFNSGDARISGFEFNFRHDLRKLGSWGRYFTVFANGTQLHLEGNPHAAFDTFLPRIANWGLSFNWKRVTIMPKWNYRGAHKITNAAGFAPDGWQYWEAQTLLDLNLGYRLSKRIALSASINNLFNEHRIRTRFGSETPSYARQFQDFEYGAIFSLGIKGTF